MEGRVVGGARVEASASTRSPLLRGLGGWHRNPDRLLRPSASAPSQRHGRRVSVQAQQVMPSFRQQPAAQADPALRRTLTRQPAPALAPPRPVQPAAAARPVFLPRNLIMNKQVIARTSGKQLGYVAQLYVDPQRMAVVSLDLRTDWISLSRSPDSSITLSALRQIGDVVLVHDETAVNDSSALAASWGAVKLIGMAVETEDGTHLGKVRDFTFSPDDGRIDSIKFDRFGLPALSDTLVSVCGLPVWEVLRVELTRLLIRSSPQISKETDGLLDRATKALFDIQAGGGTPDWDTDMAEWERQYGAAWRAFYGQDSVPLQLPSGKDRQSVRKILTAPYSEPERMPVLRQSSRARLQKAPQDPRQRRALEATPALPPSGGRPAPSSRQPRSSIPDLREQAAARSRQAAVQGVPILRREQLPAHQQRDIDGAYGEPPTASEQLAPQPQSLQPPQPPPAAQGLRYEDFLVNSDGDRDPVQAYAEQQNGWGRR